MFALEGFHKEDGTIGPCSLRKKGQVTNPKSQSRRWEWEAELNYYRDFQLPGPFCLDKV
jgi:hypothetical protein